MNFRIVGAFCCISPEFSFVVEDETGIVGYALAALNAKDFYAKLKISWIPEMQLKYPLKEGDDESEEKSASMVIFVTVVYNLKNVHTFD